MASKLIPINELDKDLLYYLASPYSALGKLTSDLDRLTIEELRWMEITEIGATLTELGFVLVMPITNSHILKRVNPNLKSNWAFWERIDTEYAKRSDALIVTTMQGWKESIGVTAEIEIFKGMNKPIYYLDPVNLTRVSR